MTSETRFQLKARCQGQGEALRAVKIATVSTTTLTFPVPPSTCAKGAPAANAPRPPRLSRFSEAPTARGRDLAVERPPDPAARMETDGGEGPPGRAGGKGNLGARSPHQNLTLGQIRPLHFWKRWRQAPEASGEMSNGQTALHLHQEAKHRGLSA